MTAAAYQTPVQMSPTPILTFDPAQAESSGPKLDCPISPELNPHVEAAHASAIRWAIEMGLVTHGPRLDHLIQARFAWLAARAYPRVDRESLELIADWITFLFFYDDLCDRQEAAEAEYQAELDAAELRLISIAEGIVVVTKTPLDRAMADIRERVAARASSAWMGRLALHLREYIEGCRWERILRQQGEVPTLATYSKLRLLISAVYPCFDFAGMCIDSRSTRIAENVRVQQLEVMANNYVCWVNDIYGVDKELGEATTSNLVIVLAKEFGLSWEQALAKAIEMCNAELAAFCALEKVMQRLGDEGCRAYVDALRSWMRGNLDWYADTGRYEAMSLTESKWN